MSLYSALFSGVSTLSAQSQSMAMVADNISNVNTIGYKSTKAAFSTLVTQTRSATTYSAGGRRILAQALVDRQGLLPASTSPTDLAISGNGFFVVHPASMPSSNNGSCMFPRAGSFSTDSDGFLRNSAGFYLQGWPMDSLGNIPANRSDLGVLESVNVQSLVGTAEPTTAVSMQGQPAGLAAAQPPGDRPALCRRRHGQAQYGPDADHRQLRAQRAGRRFEGWYPRPHLPLPPGRPDQRRRSPLLARRGLYRVGERCRSDRPSHPNGLVVSSFLKFNPDGTFNATGTTFPANLNVTWNSGLGLNSTTLTADLGTDGNTDGLTQFDLASLLVNTQVNGAVFGGMAGLSVDDDGIVTALFDNGSRVNVFKLPTATFPNANGLGNKTGNAYIANVDSGTFTLQEAGKGGAGKVAPSALEASAVELADEFSTMIVTQRAFSAGSRVVTTTDEMLDELVRVLR